MSTVSLKELQRNPEALLNRVEAGERHDERKRRVATALALATALIEYTRRGEVGLIAAGIFLVAFGLGAKGRIARN